MTDQNTLPAYAKPEFINEDGSYDHRGHALATEARIRELDAARKAPKVAPKPNEPTRADLAAVKDLSGTARTYQPANDPGPRTGIMATVQPGPGSRNSVIRGEPRETDVVSVTLPGGSKMALSLRQAADMGYVHQDAAGRFRNGPDPSSGTAAAASPGVQEPQGDPDVGVTLEASVEAGISEVHNLIEGYWGKGAAPALMSKLMATGQMPSELRVAAEKAGVPYNKVVDQIRAFAEATAERVQAVVESEGISEDEFESFMTWARATHGNVRLQSADMAFYSSGSLKTYRALAAEFRDSSWRTQDKSEGNPKEFVTALSDDGQEVRMTRGGARKLGWTIKS